MNMKAKAKRGMPPRRLAWASALLVLTLSSSAFAQGLVPTRFFNAPVDASAPAAVEANTLTFDSNTITTYDGARVTADSVDYDAALRRLMENATYAPCGECIDDDGRIGWSGISSSGPKPRGPDRRIPRLTIRG